MANLRGRGEDRLPWLQEADADDLDARFGFGRMIGVLAAIFVGAVLITLIVWWFAFREGSLFGSGQLIRAPAGPYREKPASAGGMRVEGTGDLSYGASEGQDVDSAIDLNAVAETPVAGPGAEKPTAPPAAAPLQALIVPQRTPAGTAPAPTPPAVASAPAVVQAPAAASGAGGTIQLGAFSSSAKAQAAWKSLSGRFAFLGGLASSVVTVESDGKTLYRLRAAAGPQAAGLCQRLKVAGETCSVVG